MFNSSFVKLDIPAAAVECIHSYVLIHDDLPAMDDHNLRRGNNPTCYLCFGEAHAILAGDALQTLALNILSRSAMPGVSNTHRLAMI